jgi:hypothetical protein
MSLGPTFTQKVLLLTKFLKSPLCLMLVQFSHCECRFNMWIKFAHAMRKPPHKKIAQEILKILVLAILSMCTFLHPNQKPLLIGNIIFLFHTMHINRAKEILCTSCADLNPHPHKEFTLFPCGVQSLVHMWI